MGKETKTEEKKEETREQEKKEEELQEIVLKVDMHCEACTRKVARALKGFEGVEEVTADSKASRVMVKGKTADPIKVCERLQKRSGRKVEILSPLPKPPLGENKQETKETPNKDQKDQEQPVTVVLHVRMHCEACAQRLQKRIRKIPGVESVETNLQNSQVIVKGVVDPEKLVDDVYKKIKKQVSIVKDQEDQEDKKKEGGEKEKAEEEEDTKFNIKRSEFWPSNNFLEYAYPPEIFSDENPNACSLM